MAQPTIQTSFSSGEWAPKLRARVDLAKYKSGAALLRNFFIDYSGGGASTRQGTKFINQCKSLGARLIPFQPSTTLSYELEFGQNYIRFYSNGSPILETATTITGATQANPGVITDVAHGYVTGDWVFISAVGGMTQLNGNYYIVVKTGADTYTLTDLNGNAINTTTFGAYTAGGTAQRVYTITSPFATSDLFPNPLTGNPGIKFVQDVTSMIICHPSYPAQILTILSVTNWTLTAISFASTIPAPAQPTITSTSSTGGGWNYAYLVTAVDVNGQESAPSVVGTISNLSLISSAGITNEISWTAVPGAVSYNVYKASPAVTTAIQAGAPYGFIGNTTGNSFLDAYPGIIPDFAQTPPIVENPFLGSGVVSYTVQASDVYTTVPTVIVAAPGSGTQATAVASLGILTAVVNSGTVNATQLYSLGNGVVVIGLTATTVAIVSAGSITSGSTPANPVKPSDQGQGSNLNFNLTWGVTAVNPIQDGTGYASVPAVTFSAGAAAATAVLGTASGGNPGVPGFIQERLMLAGQPKSIQSYNLSQPGSFFNFNVSNPTQNDDAISGTIIAEELNDIRNLTPVPTGMIAFTGKGAWLINGGGGISTQVPITPSNQTAQPQGFNGANDMKPIKINMDALYVTNKGNYVRDLTYNLYAQIFTGRDVSQISNHLFFNYYMFDWAWSEEPFKTLWCIRGDGQMLSFGFVKDELEAWAHHDTNGQFTSVCSVIENVNGNIVDAIYVIVQRLINGNTVQYVERMADRYFTYGYEDAWSVDCALQTQPVTDYTLLNITMTIVGADYNVGTAVIGTISAGGIGWVAGQVVRVAGGIVTVVSSISGTQFNGVITQAFTTGVNQYTSQPFPTSRWSFWEPTSTVSGLTQLIGQSVVGVADGAVVGPFVVSATGSVALGVTATKVTLGLAYLPQLITLPLDLGEPTVQGKRKKITGVTVRVADTLGLSIGKTFGTLTPMKDFTLGNVPTTSSGPAKVTGLVSGDGRTIIDQEWDEAGSYCFQQNLPYPATILGAMPEVMVGDTK